MAQQPNNVVQAWAARPPIDPIRPADAAVPPDLPLFRFSLRHLFFFVAVLSVLLSALVTLHGILALAFLLAALVVAFHILSTALGSQLRQYAARNHACEKGPVEVSTPLAAAPVSPPQHEELKLRSPWYGRSGATFAWLPRLVVISIFFGGVFGAIGLIATIGHRISLAGLVVGTFSIAALTGWAAFLGGNFVAIVRGGMSEAVEEQTSKEGRRSISN
jgi:hypothetical protein